MINRYSWWDMLTIPDIVSSLDSASVLILSCFFALESQTFCVLWITADPSPKKPSRGKNDADRHSDTRRKGDVKGNL